MESIKLNRKSIRNTNKKMHILKVIKYIEKIVTTIICGILALIIIASCIAKHINNT